MKNWPSCTGGTSVTAPAAAWRFTGLHWELARPVLTASQLPGDPAALPGPETRRPAGPGTSLSWHLDGPRRCTGAWAGTARRPCAARAEISARGTDAQCPACALADRGRQIAKDAALGDDGREHRLYLAWFGPGLVKIGLTAADRGRDRLLEQGAITFTMLAVGPYVPVRQAERLTAAAGLARERITAAAKAAAWQAMPPPAERAAQLAAARKQVTEGSRWPGQVRSLPDDITDQADDFGLDQEDVGAYQEVTSINDGALLAGQVRLVIGRDLLLDTPAGPLLMDMRRGAGWAIRPSADASAPPAGLTLTDRPTAGAPDVRQQTLF
jgi:Protein of unknown function (DUF2797)